MPWFAPGQPFVFKNLMIHWILQFTRLIAFRYALHRCESQEIHYQEFMKFRVCVFKKFNKMNKIKMKKKKNKKKLFFFFAFKKLGNGMDITVNDPSAGSPTETLLRLLLPLKPSIRWHLELKSTDESVSKIPPASSPKTSIGRSDGRCVQNTGSYSMHADDMRLQGNPVEDE